MTDEEIIKALAEKVMGLTDIRHIEVITGFGRRRALGTTRRYKMPDGRMGLEAKELPNPLTNPEDAFEVLRLLLLRGRAISLEYVHYLNGPQFAVYVKGQGKKDPIAKKRLPSGSGKDADICRAVCIAALKAVGAWTD